MRSRLGELPSSDEMEMFHTEHDFQVDLENLRVQLEISCRENTTLVYDRTYYTICLITRCARGLSVIFHDHQCDPVTACANTRMYKSNFTTEKFE